MKILIACDKFKFTFSSIEISDLISDLLKSKYPDFEIKTFPVSDGGEGFLDALIYNGLSFKKITIKTINSLKNKIDTGYLIIDDCAFIETAKIIGLNLIPKEKQNPVKTTTYGIGKVIIDAYNRNVKNIFLSLGGSSTNDGGIGLAQALGVKFYDIAGNIVDAIPENLPEIADFDASDLKINLSDLKFTVLTDVKNCLLGENGATYTFSEQKGATDSDKIFLENGLKNLAEIVTKKRYRNFHDFSGSGAAGGLAYGCAVFLNAEIQSGTEFILKKLNLENEIRNSDLIITGEGKFDKQTLDGKIVSGIIDLCKKYNKKVFVICGISEISGKETYARKILPFYDDKSKIILSKPESEKILKRIISETDFIC